MGGRGIPGHSHRSNAGLAHVTQMPVAKRTVTIVHRQGLHARPAALFVELAKRFTSRVTVRKGRKVVDGKSIMGLLTLAANQGARISITTDGPDAVSALERLIDLLTKPLPETPNT